jgi:hypothetical protein
MSDALGPMGGLGGPPVVGPPMYVRDGERFVATISTRGPWSPDHQHGGPPAALCARALERLAGADTLLARMTFDFLRPVPIATLSVKAEVVRAGRKVQRLRAVLLAPDGQELVHATAVALRMGPVLENAILDPDAPPRGPETSTPGTFPFFKDATGYHHAVEVRMARGTWGDASVNAWMRTRVPLVADEATSPTQRLLINVDSASGLAVTLDRKRHSWVNADLTVALHRLPDGEWIGLDATTSVEAHGVGLTRARLRDVRGPVGVSLQSLVIEAVRG